MTCHTANKWWKLNLHLMVSPQSLTSQLPHRAASSQGGRNKISGRERLKLWDKHNLFTGCWISVEKSGWQRAFPYSFRDSVTFFQRSLKPVFKNIFFFHLVSLLLSACMYFLILKGLNWVKHEVSFLPALSTWSYAPNLIFLTLFGNESAIRVNHTVTVCARPEAYCLFFPL